MMLSPALAKTIVKKSKKEKKPPPAWYLQPPASRPKPKDWTISKPHGLYVRENAISDETHAKLLAYLEQVPWIQRFGKQYPKTAHHNYMYTTKEETESGHDDAELRAEYPELFETAHEVFNSMKSEIPPGTHAAFDNFEPQRISVHKHCPNWGLGAHYDNSHDEGDGLVLMLNVVKEDPTKTAQIQREFLFTDPPGGRKFGVFTPAKMGMVFTGNAYDYWRHESVRNPKQTVTNYSITIRLKKVCGYGKTMADQLKYKPGAPAAEKVAHQRIAAMRESGMDY